MGIAPKLTRQKKQLASVRNPISVLTVPSYLARTTAPTHRLRRLVSASKTIRWHTANVTSPSVEEVTTAPSSTASTSAQAMGSVAMTDSVYAKKITTAMIAVFSSL